MDNFRKVREQVYAAIEAGLEAVGASVAGQAAELAPVDTGRLKGSITWATQAARSDVKAPAKDGDGVPNKATRNTVVVGTSVEYAPHVEYGTKHQEAQPYLRRSVELLQGDVPAIFEQTFRDNLK